MTFQYCDHSLKKNILESIIYLSKDQFNKVRKYQRSVCLDNLKDFGF